MLCRIWSVVWREISLPQTGLCGTLIDESRRRAVDFRDGADGEWGLRLVSLAHAG